MKKSKIIIAGLLVVALLAGCGKTNTNPTATPGNGTENNNNNSQDQPTTTPAQNVEDPEKNITEPTGDFTITVDAEKGGDYTVAGGVYTIKAAGTYKLTGTLENGCIVVDAGDDAEVNIELAGCKITSSTSAPITVESAKEVKIKSENETTNIIQDNRAELTDDATDSVNAAIYAKCDLSLTGKGTLVVKTTCNNGIQTKDTLTIKNVTLKVEAVNNAIKGNQEVVIESGELFLVSYKGDGIKTSDTGLTKKGNQKGNVTIAGGNVTIYATYDGIDAAFNLQIDTEGNIAVYTGKYNTYTQSASAEGSIETVGWWGGGPGGGGWGGNNNQSNKNTPSAKAFKAGNSIIINNGTISLSTEDDGMNAGSDDAFESGVKSAGEVVINNGTITITSGDDGIHGDSYVNINNGIVNITTSYEGIEANVINMNGGKVYVYATDDGLNACSGSKTPLINITGGYLDVTTGTGDTDAIDSNGNVTMSGGIALIKGGNSQGNVAGSVDVDGKITITGGTMIALGGICELPENSQNAYASSTTSFSAGTYTLKNSKGNEIYSFTLSSSFKGMWVCSDSLTTGETFTVYKDNTSLVSWTQTSGTMGSSGGFGGFGGFGGGGRH